MLPIGVIEFNEWSNRIISGAMVKANIESQKFALAGMLLQLGSKEIFKEDGFFITQLRKAATDQTAQYIMKDIKAQQQERIMKEAAEEATKNEQGAVTPAVGATHEVLPDQKV